ncbi:hypothetical protein G9A89_009490 [Geosiphon pyriformis]|nr:hypothetical protein G9A89_009490 [Geosiphon pyriformis]
MFNKGGNSNKFQMKAWTGEKGALKSLKKIDRPSKTPKKDSKRAAQIEAALRKCNLDILNRINSGNSVVENEEQMNNLFVANKDKADMNDTAEDMEDSELGLSSRIASPSPGQYRSKSLGKKPMFMEPNYEEGWKTVVHGTKRHVLFVQALDILEKNMGKKAKEVLANKEIDSFLMAINGITNLMAGQRKVLVRDIPLGISDREVGAVMKEFGRGNQSHKPMVNHDQKDAVRIYPMIGTQKVVEQRKTWEAKLVDLPQNCTAHYLSTTLDQIKAQSCFIPRTSKNYTRMGCAYIGFDSKASHNSATKKPLVIGDTLVHWVPTDAKECHFCYQVGHLVSKCPILHKKKEGDTKKATNNIRLAKLYVRKNVPEESIKDFGGKLYAEMVALRLPHKLNNTNSNRSPRTGLQVNNKEGQPKKGINQLWKAEIDKLRQQINKMAKLLSAVTAKLGVTVEKEKDILVAQQQKAETRVLSQSTTSKSDLEEKKEAYDPEREIRVIKETLEPILELLKQVKKQGGWGDPAAGESKLIETDDVGRISVHIVGLYMPASKSPTEKAVAKEIRKLLGDIVQNKEIIIVAGDLNEDMSSKSLEETFATNKVKACSTATTLQHMNLVNTHGAYTINNPEKTWASNGVQRRLDYVFTDVVTASMVTNIGVVDVNELFSTDHKAVITMF